MVSTSLLLVLAASASLVAAKRGGTIHVGGGGYTDDEGNISIGAIIGIVIGVLILCCCIAYFCNAKKNEQPAKTDVEAAAVPVTVGMPEKTKYDAPAFDPYVQYAPPPSVPYGQTPSSAPVYAPPNSYVPPGQYAPPTSPPTGQYAPPTNPPSAQYAPPAAAPPK
ncbi:hypothetical protein HK098_004598 [Nowakowskiella sp. JEL0407]|nr:hypothetical protein HK098_004598 [Nowakowskiella sp. JEL0407]